MQPQLALEQPDRSNYETIEGDILFELFGKIFVRGNTGGSAPSAISVDEKGTISYIPYNEGGNLTILGHGEITAFTSTQKAFVSEFFAGGGGLTIFEISESAKTIAKVVNIQDSADYAASDNYFYVAHDDKIQRMSLADFSSVETFNFPSDYRELISISPTDTTVRITAGLNTGQTVVSELNCTTGVFKTLTESSSSTITLERIR